MANFKKFIESEKTDDKIQIGDTVKYGYDRGVWIRIKVTKVSGSAVTGTDKNNKEHKLDSLRTPWNFV